MRIERLFTTGAANPSVATVKVDVAVRVVAAGIFSRDGTPYARATLALTPVTCTDQCADDAIDLAEWPERIGELIKGGVRIAIWPLGDDAGRGSPPATPPVVTMHGKGHPIASAGALNAYWWQVMGGKSGLTGLTAAFSAGGGTLASVLRKSAAGSDQTPDIHGTERSGAAVALTLERACQIIDRLAKRKRPTRPPADQDKIGEEAKKTMTGDADRLQDFRAQREKAEEQAALKTLGSSGERADAAARARRNYLDAEKPDQAIDFLTVPECHVNRRPPITCARDLLSAPTAGPQIDQAHAAFQLASRPASTAGESKLPDDVASPDLETARRRFFALQAHPSLARLFRFVVDTECKLSELTSTLESASVKAAEYPEASVLDHDEPASVNRKAPRVLPDAAEAKAWFLLLAAQMQPAAAAGRMPRIFTAAKLRLPNGDQHGHFYPCAREEIDARAAKKDVATLRKLAIAEQIDGIVDLAQQVECRNGTEPRFDVLTLDAVTATAADLSYERGRAVRGQAIRNSAQDLPPEIVAEHDEKTEPRRATLRTGGLALTDRWRQSHAVIRHLASMRQIDQLKASEKKDLILDASDLTIGYKLDVGVKSKRDHKTARRRWHTLMRRKVKFAPHGYYWPLPGKVLDEVLRDLYPDSIARLRADDGVLTVPAALRNWDQQPPDRAKTTAFTEEIVGA
jgi:hypothetical protein